MVTVKLKFYILLMMVAEVFMSVPKPYEARFEYWKSTGLTSEFRVRLLGRDHRLNGSIIVREDLDNDFYISGQTYNDATGSGNYKATPFSASKIHFCEFIKTYWSYFAPSMEYGKNTDCPFINYSCPLPKGEYYVKDVIIKTDGWPYQMPRGFFKAVSTLEKGNDVVGTTEFIVRFSDRT